MKKIPVISMLALCLTPSLSTAQKQWTLDECIRYALEHNIQIKQNMLSSASLQEDVLQSKAALFPSLSASTNHNVAYRPNALSTINLTNGTMTSSSNKVSYNGSYGINANWTVWNGGRNVKNIEKSKYNSEIAELQTEQTANSIQEQIAQLYVQILYENEAVKVNEEIVKASEMQRDRAKVMVEVGSLARVDLTQLEAQVTQDQYSLVSARSQLANYKLQLKQLLELHGGESFDVVIPSIDDSEVLALIPSEEDVYLAALNMRPEIESGKLNIESSQLDLAIAKAGYWPTLSLTASIGTNNASGTHTPYFKQIKNNWSNSLGLTLSVPIYDQRSTRTSVNKARIAIQESQLSLQDTEKQLYSNIENYWLNATTAQQQYIYAKANVESMQQTYDLVSEQFRLGLKNIVELTTGKNNLLQAQQQLLQTKYTALLNRALLRFYQGEELKL
ncbi:MAG: TolC family protein [Bacteroidaceae bacterium]|jgi:outer membrane protein|nr:TolC family protein [Bacteroidaceae bacterium]